MIQTVLADAEARQEQNQAVKLWLKRLEGVAFDADHLFDKLNYEILRRQVKSRNQFLEGKVCFFSFSSANIAFRLRMASKVRAVKVKLGRIAQETNDFGLNFKHQIGGAHPATAGATTSRQTDSIVAPNVVGRDKDEQKIIEMLLSPSEKSVSVIPITGMGGLGKTTLAKSVYNNPQIDQHFGKTIWVCVGRKIEIVDLFKVMLESLTKEKVRVETRDVIVQKIQEQLKEKRYFLVLDDVWNDEQGLWDDFFNTLKGLNAINGNWCLVTTRQTQVANTMSQHLKMNIDPYKLGKLSKDECWAILKEKVIGAEEVPKELEALKEQILKRCDGLPLAANLIGGLLLKKGKKEWQSIVKESYLNGDHNDIKQILKVSFDHLSPASVKKCFAYCSIFPQDTMLNKDLLIELWMAEGFLQSDSKSDRLMEAIGDEYFRILLQSSLLEEAMLRTYRYYKMHDLVHDFAKSVLNPKISNEDHYLALSSSEGTAENIKKKISTSLRTLLLDSGICSGVLSKFEYLHVLKLSGRNVNMLPSSIGKLIHLRFLGISNIEIKTFPDSFYKLFNLQTLRLENSFVQEGLPKHMSNLISLRHLHYFVPFAQFQMPLRIGRLTCLQTLKFFNIGRENGRGIEELGPLKDLKGGLVIRNLELVNGKKGAEQAKLFEKSNLYQLEFEWGSQDRDGNNCDDDDVLEGLQPHPNLKEFEIGNFTGENFPQWLMNLSSLVKLNLTKCYKCSKLPTLGQLPFLESLELRELEKVKCIGLSFYGINNDKTVMPKIFFPALKYLNLYYMKSLVQWKGAEEVRSATGEAQVILFPVLEILRIYGCFQLTRAPCHDFLSIRELDLWKNPHVLLAEKILSNITTLSALDLDDYKNGVYNTHQHIDELKLVTPRGKGSSLMLKSRGNLPDEMIERLCHIPSLQRLRVVHCPNLTSLRSGCGTCLEDLELWKCKNLREMPEDLYKFQALRRLKIKECPKINQLVIPVKGQKCLLTSLEEFIILDCDGFTSLPLEMLESCTSLRRMSVFGCPNLIINMPKRFAFLTSLEELTIGPFTYYSSIIEFDWSGLKSSSTLRCLYLYGSPQLECLPDQLQYLTSLTELRLYEFGIEALPDWLGNLGSLQKLFLFQCHRLRSLPSVDAMARLTKLTSLHAPGCFLLRETCINSRISKIYNFYINFFSD